MANIIDVKRKELYHFFDTKVIEILKTKNPETDEELVEVEDEISNLNKKYEWHLRKYNYTYRLSAFSLSPNYLYFMIWTPDGEEEYKDWESDYYGSRRGDND